MNILEDITKTSIKLILKEPFYGHFFSTILKDVSDKTDSISITLSGKQMLKLIVNEDFWRNTLKGSSEDQTHNLKYGQIKHNVLHIVFKHIFRSTEFGHKQIYNIASDIAVNQYINENQLLPDSITLELFPDFELKRDQTVDYYYKVLFEQFMEMAQSQNGQGGSESGGNENQPGGNTGSGENGGQNDSKPKDSLGDAKNSSQQKLKELLENGSQHLDQHNGWDEIVKVGKSERKILESMIENGIINSVNRQKDRGTLPGGLQQYIDLLIESMKPNVNWKRVLKIFAASSFRTSIRNTIRRPSKRYGTTPGVKIQRKQKLLVAIDTSGSVSDDELRDFFGEMYHIWKQGAEIMIVECDTQIGNTYLYKGVPPTVISGRGGTDFNPPLEFAQTYNPDAIIYFTDGGAPNPEVTVRCPILWMISNNGINEDGWDFLEGRKVKMN